MDRKQKSSRSIKRRKLNIDSYRIVDLTDNIQEFQMRQSDTNKQYIQNHLEVNVSESAGAKQQKLFTPPVKQISGAEKSEGSSRIMRNSFFFSENSQEEEYNNCMVRPNSSRKGNEEVKEKQVPKTTRRLSTMRNKNKNASLLMLEPQEGDFNIIELVNNKINKTKEVQYPLSTSQQQQQQPVSKKKQIINHKKESQKQIQKESSTQKQTIFIPLSQTNNAQQILLAQKESLIQHQSPIQIDSLSQLFSFFNKTNTTLSQNQIMYQSIPQNYIFRGYIKRLSKEFLLMYSDDGTFMMRSQKKSAVIGCNHYFSTNKETSKNEFYLGKLRSDISKTNYILYDDGVSQKDAKDAKNKNAARRMQYANIQFQNSIFQLKQPKKINVIIPNPKVQDIKHFVLPDNDSLSSLKVDFPYELVAFKNRKPYWNESKNTHALDFGTRVKVSSIKNIILETGTNRSVLIFGKADADTFSIQIAYPLSPFQGFGIAVSVFDVK